MQSPSTPNDINVRSPHYLIARTLGRCWHCRAMTPLFALVVPPGHETVDLDDESADDARDEGHKEVCGGARGEALNEAFDEAADDAPEDVPNEETDDAANEETDETRDKTRDEIFAAVTWRIAPQHAILFLIEFLPADVLDRLAAETSSYRFGRPNPPESGLVNHCTSCDSLQGDHELFCEPEGAFVPTSASSAGTIQLLRVDLPFEAAAGGYAYEPAFFDSMRMD
jgi:hypothetical protein